MKRGPQPGRALMIQGTGSDVGKSLIVAGLARAYARRGISVRPFKPQNMSNNAAVTSDGGEIGRAQALQARAAGVPPSVHMNPVLLKPQSDASAQVVVRGRVFACAGARDYHSMKRELLPEVLDSFAQISAEAGLVLVEGAGSPAEVNLRENDIANMGFAEAADLPVILVGDIDRGGVIAGIVGTHALLSPPERARLKGYVINKFRGDPALFVDAIEIIKARTGLSCLGVLPYFEKARLLPAEDGVALDNGAYAAAPPAGGAIRIAVPRLPRIANFDDLDPLAGEPDVRIEMTPPGQPLPAGADLILIPGSKATLADLAFLRGQGWDIDILAHARRGGRVLGICAGYQMLGRRIADPLGVEGTAGEAEGLGLLDVETVISGEKTLALATGTHGPQGAPESVPVSGYEMHAGETAGPDCARPMLNLSGPDGGSGHGAGGGAQSRDGRIQGCYLHGLFADDGFRRAFLARFREDKESPDSAGRSYEAGVEETLDALAGFLEEHLDLDRIFKIAGDRA